MEAKPDRKGDLKEAWRVMRQDDNGNKFVVQDKLSEKFAREMAEEMTRRGHKQFYWHEPMPRPARP